MTSELSNESPLFRKEIWIGFGILRLGLVLACTLLFLLTASCTSISDREGLLRLAFVTNNASDFWTIARRGCEKAEQDFPGISVEFQIPAAGTAAEQKRILDDLIAKGTDGIAISPVDPVNQIQMLNDAARRTLLITHDSDAPESERICYVGTDNRAAGRQAGELIREALPDGGRIMIFVGMIDAQNAQERYQGIRESLAGSEIEIIDVRTDDTDRVRAKANVLDTLVTYPDIEGLVGLWSYNGPAIVNAVKEVGKLGEVRIICFDEEDETLAGVRDGSIDATVVQQPFEFGYQSIRLMVELLDGNESEIPPGRQIFIPTLVIRQGDVDAFIDRINRLRGRN